MGPHHSKSYRAFNTNCHLSKYQFAAHCTPCKFPFHLFSNDLKLEIMRCLYCWCIPMIIRAYWSDAISTAGSNRHRSVNCASCMIISKLCIYKYKIIRNARKFVAQQWARRMRIRLLNQPHQIISFFGLAHCNCMRINDVSAASAANVIILQVDSCNVIINLRFSRSEHTLKSDNALLNKQKRFQNKEMVFFL